MRKSTPDKFRLLPLRLPESVERNNILATSSVAQTARGPSIISGNDQAWIDDYKRRAYTARQCSSGKDALDSHTASDGENVTAHRRRLQVVDVSLSDRTFESDSVSPSTTRGGTGKSRFDPSRGLAPLQKEVLVEVSAACLFSDVFMNSRLNLSILTTDQQHFLLCHQLQQHLTEFKRFENFARGPWNYIALSMRCLMTTLISQN
mmetsp:Transcript_7941/g.23913  ORF Transcript_7941/g.23913 Transcript_7941/m.23913 type:complete len:205 (+) Transcript_7941:228-842(+)